ncbi:MAG: LysM peptidoglycan-binding domain-containing protein [Verrucomicrobia bacterium]|nr:LysM peptidoglycan-binding domain-containing protein [Verrucomicrobiota bacterium]
MMHAVFMRRIFSAAVALAFALAACDPPNETHSISDDRNPWLKKAEIEMQRRNYSGAAEFYEKALQLNPASMPMHWAAAMLYEQHLKDFPSAIFHYQRFVALKPEPARVKMANEFIERAKYSLAAGLAHTPVEGASEFQQVQQQNKALQEQVEQLRQALRAAEMRLANLTQPPAMPPAEPTEPGGPSRPVAPPRAPAVAQQQGIAPAPIPVPVPVAPPVPQNTGAVTPPPAPATNAAPAVTAGTKPINPTKTQRYTVKRGDTLAAIADKYYGDRNAWMQIYKANKSAIPNKDRLLVGTVLTIPARGSR